MEIVVLLAVITLVLQGNTKVLSEFSTPIFRLKEFCFTSNTKVQHVDYSNYWKVRACLPDYTLSKWHDLTLKAQNHNGYDI